ncbi:MAG: hypothetical protein H0T89_25105 [Deltaproteobacteria bacterium]|nr:hypothetical protein [Deltaproteobacteria bacterium]MDQ3299327.1 hypothetical protein [Myxococcota bacterium]
MTQRHRIWAINATAIGRLLGWLTAGLLVMACSSSDSKPAAAKGRIIVAVTIDWEGAVLDDDALDALDALRDTLGPTPITHFVSAAYFTKQPPDATASAAIRQAVRPGDELAVHLHAWRSLAKASEIEPKLAPSFLTGTDKLLEFPDGDVGFDVDVDAYSVADLRALLRTSRKLLEAAGTVSKSFRAGGYLGTPKMLQAIRDEGYRVDSSATDHRQLDLSTDEVLARRVAEIWPKIDVTSQPFLVPGPGRPLVEIPIAAFADDATAVEMVAVFDAAHARLRKEPTRDVFVVLGFHQETATEFASRIAEVVAAVRARREIAGQLLFTTIEYAGELARGTLVPAP